jgi:hypothetical protein
VYAWLQPQLSEATMVALYAVRQEQGIVSTRELAGVIRGVRLQQHRAPCSALLTESGRRVGLTAGAMAPSVMQ